MTKQKKTRAVAPKEHYFIKVMSKLTGENIVIEHEDKSLQAMAIVFPITKTKMTVNEGGKPKEIDVSVVINSNSNYNKIAYFKSKKEAHEAALAIVENIRKNAIKQDIKEEIVLYYQIVEVFR